MILSSFDIVFIFLSMILQNICLNNSRKMLSNSRKRISINVFNICLITLTKLNCFLMICVNFLSLFEINDLDWIKFNLFHFFIFGRSKVWIDVGRNFFHCNVYIKNISRLQIFAENNFICQVDRIRIVFVTNILYRRQDCCLLFSVLQNSSELFQWKLSRDFANGKILFMTRSTNFH